MCSVQATTRPNRRGFTLLELIVVVAVIALLVALLLPAVQQAREGARRMACRNNLRQLGLAFGSYHQTYDVLPPGATGTKSPLQHDPTEPHFAWTVHLLPFIEEAPMYEAIDFHATAYPTDRLMSLQGNLLSDEGIVQEWAQWEGTPEDFALEYGVDEAELAFLETHGVLPPDNTFALDPSNMEPLLICPSSWKGDNLSYVGLHHHAPRPITDDDSGLLFLNSSVTWADVTDGRAMTALLAESDYPLPVSWAVGSRATLRFPNVRPPNADDRRVIESGLFVHAGHYLSLDDAVLEASGFSRDEFDETLEAVSLGSAHLQGMHVLMADGAVRFLDTHHAVMPALVHRSDAAPLETF